MPSVKPGDDFDRFANGKWQDTYQLKDYESDYGSFDMLNDQSEIAVRDIIEELAKRTDLAPGSDEQKIRDYYASYMDQAARDAAGIKPLQPVLDRITRDRVDDRPHRRLRSRRTSKAPMHPSASAWPWIARIPTATSSAWASAASACPTRTTTSTRTRASSPSARPTSRTSPRCSVSPASTAPMPRSAPRR